MRLILAGGLLAFIVSVCMLLWAVIAKIMGNTVAGWTSLMGSIWLAAGIQLLSLGIVGEYIGKIYSETKQRPRYIIESIINDTGDVSR